MLANVRRPAALAEALALLGEEGRAPQRRLLAYGSDVLVWLKTGRATTEELIDLTGLKELRKVEAEADGLRLGAGLSVAEIGRHPSVRERFPALAQAVHHMGSVQLREGASLGGNICTSSPAGDTAPPLIAYGARYRLVRTAGERDIPGEDFYLAPGKNASRPDEVLHSVFLPWPSPGAQGVFLKAARRAAVDLALASVAAVASPDKEAPCGIHLTLALGAVAPTPIRASRGEDFLRRHGLALGEEERRVLVDLVGQDAKPIDDVRATAKYRQTLVGQLTLNAMEIVGKALATGTEEVSG